MDNRQNAFIHLICFVELPTLPSAIESFSTCRDCDIKPKLHEGKQLWEGVFCLCIVHSKMRQTQKWRGSQATKLFFTLWHLCKSIVGKASYCQDKICRHLQLFWLRPYHPALRRLAVLNNNVMIAVEKVAKQSVPAAAGRLRKSLYKLLQEDYKSQCLTLTKRPSRERTALPKLRFLSALMTFCLKEVFSTRARDQTSFKVQSFQSHRHGQHGLLVSQHKCPCTHTHHVCCHHRPSTANNSICGWMMWPRTLGGRP